MSFGPVWDGNTYPLALQRCNLSPEGSAKITGSRTLLQSRVHLYGSELILLGDNDWEYTTTIGMLLEHQYQLSGTFQSNVWEKQVAD